MNAPAAINNPIFASFRAVVAEDADIMRLIAALRGTIPLMTSHRDICDGIDLTDYINSLVAQANAQGDRTIADALGRCWDGIIAANKVMV